MQTDVERLAETPFDSTPEYFRRVLEARLSVGELSVEAVHFAPLHQGHMDTATTAAAQRRLREAYFVAILTPATKHLRRLLANQAGSAAV